MYGMLEKIESGNLFGEMKSVTKCSCGGTFEVINSRRVKQHSEEELAMIYRRRRCNACGERFTTYEISDDDLERIAYNIETINRMREILK